MIEKAYKWYHINVGPNKWLVVNKSPELKLYELGDGVVDALYLTRSEMERLTLDFSKYFKPIEDEQLNRYWYTEKDGRVFWLTKDGGHVGLKHKADKLSYEEVYAMKLDFAVQSELIVKDERPRNSEHYNKLIVNGVPLEPNDIIDAMAYAVEPEIKWYSDNIVKYALRHPFKGQQRKDLEKIRDYATLALERLRDDGN